MTSNEGTILWSIGFAVLYIALQSMLRQQAATTPNACGQVTIRPHTGLRWIGSLWIFMAPLGLMLNVYFQKHPNGVSDYLGAIGFAAIGSAIILHTARWSCCANSTGLHVVDMFGHTFHVPWADVVRLDGVMWVRVTSRSGGWRRIPSSLPRFGEFSRVVLQHVPEDRISIVTLSIMQRAANGQ